MTSFDGNERPDVVTIRRLAAALGLSPENIRALERRGRFPAGCEPALDPISGTRYWTPSQVEQLRKWNDERPHRAENVEALNRDEGLNRTEDQ